MPGGASRAEATALSTESKCFRKKPVTRPTVDMMATMASTFGEPMAARLEGPSASSAWPCNRSTSRFTRMDWKYMKAFLAP